jgi:hypothetical protein
MSWGSESPEFRVRIDELSMKQDSPLNRYDPTTELVGVSLIQRAGLVGRLKFLQHATGSLYSSMPIFRVYSLIWHGFRAAVACRAHLHPGYRMQHWIPLQRSIRWPPSIRSHESAPLSTIPKLMT